jgi:hypothetical protein
MPLPSAHEVLGAMITPAVLISASGTLVLSTSNRLSRVVDRVRVLAQEAEHLLTGSKGLESGRGQLISNQLVRLSQRVVLLRSAMTALYASIGLLVATSIAVGLSAALGWAHGWAPIGLGLVGSCSLLYGSILLVREARLAVGSTLQELEFLEKALSGGDRGDTAHR